MQLRRVFLLAFGLVVACGSSVDGFSDETPSVAGGAIIDASASRPPQPVNDCPADQPTNGESCRSASSCEYGFAADPSCNVHAVCASTWQLDVPSVFCRDECPAAWDTYDEGASCPKPGSVCSFVEATCGCVGDADADAGVDGGDAGAALGTWTCTRPRTGCPARRPIIGNTCVNPMSCDYGTCLFGRDLTFSCDNGAWIDNSLFCN